MKKIVVSMMAVILACFVMPMMSHAQVADGTYSISYQVNAAGESSASIANDYFVKPAKLIVENGAMKVQLTIKNSNWVTEFASTTGGNTVLSTNAGANTRLVQFNLASFNGPTVIKMKVDIDDIDYHHSYSTDFIWYANSLTLIEAAAKPAQPAQAAPVQQQAAKPAAQPAQPATQPVQATQQATNQATQNVAEEKAKADAATKAAEEKAAAEAKAKEQEEKAEAEAKEEEEQAKAEAEAKEQQEQQQAEEKAKQEEAAKAEETKVETVAAATEEAEQTATQEVKADSKNNSGMMWVFIILGMVIIGVATTVIMKKRQA